MVFTVAQTTAFFVDQMGIPEATRQELQHEGCVLIDDLANFTDDTWKQVAENFKKPRGMVPDPAVNGGMMPAPPIVFGAMSMQRLKVASDLVKYYEEVGRAPTPASMAWNPVMKNFAIHWKALKDRKDKDPPDVPKITKALPVMKWTEAFQDYLTLRLGARTIPLSYVIRTTVDVPEDPPALMAGQPYSGEDGSVEDELVARASHAHALFKTDNMMVYSALEEATRGTTFSTSLKPFQRSKNGRGAWLAILHQYAGKDKHEAAIKMQEQVLYTRQWRGNSHFTLEQFVSLHRNAFVQMQASSAHVKFQLPNEYTRVGLLLTAIQTSDAALQAAMSAVRVDAHGMRGDFERAVAHLLPHDPVALKKASSSKRDNSNISGADAGANISGTEGKPSRGKTGVHLRYYKRDEYNDLTSEQKAELKEWRQANPDGKKSKKKGQGGKRYNKKQIDSLVSKRMKTAVDKETEEVKAAEEFEATIMSCVQKALRTPPTPPATAASVETPNIQSSLRAIIGRAKNAKKERD